MVEDILYESRFGGLRLWISRLSTNKSRTLVKHELSSGDDYVVQDRGRELLSATASLLFDWMDGDQLSPLQRLNSLRAAIDDQPRIFAHPVEGSFLARVGDFKYDIDESGVISAQSVEFVAVSDVQAVATATAGNLLGPGIGIASVAVDELLAELEDSGITSTTPAIAQATVDGWTDDTSPREILAETGSVTSMLGAQADGYDSDIGLWQAFKQTVILAEAVRIAADAATSTSASTFLVRIGTPIALRALLQNTYPADEADERYDDIMQLNDIASPWSIDQGTELLMPLPAPLPRGA